MQLQFTSIAAANTSVEISCCFKFKDLNMIIFSSENFSKPPNVVWMCEKVLCSPEGIRGKVSFWYWLHSF